MRAALPFLFCFALALALGCSSSTTPMEGGVDASADSPIVDTGAAMDVAPDAPPACSCTSAQFCKDKMTCVDATFANLCTDPNTTVVLDGQMTDDDAAHVLGEAIKAACMTALRYTSGQSIPGVLEPATSRPITGPGDMVVLSGGPFFQAPAKFMEASLSPIFSRDAQNGTHIQVVERKNQNVALDAPINMLTATHDYFLLQLAFEPQSGTLVFESYGLYGA